MNDKLETVDGILAEMRKDFCQGCKFADDSGCYLDDNAKCGEFMDMMKDFADRLEQAVSEVVTDAYNQGFENGVESVN